MLRNVPDLISPDFLKILAEMGHGDDLVIGDLNFPAASHARHLVRLDGLGVEAVLDAVLELFPLDTFVASPVMVMQVVGEPEARPPIQDRIRSSVARWDSRPDAVIAIDRFEFYQRTRDAYAVVATSERQLYGCAILKKGVVSH